MMSNPDLLSNSPLAIISSGNTLTNMLSTLTSNIKVTKVLTIRPILDSYPILIMREKYKAIVEIICIEIIPILISLPFACFLCPFILLRKVSISIDLLKSPWKFICKSMEHINLKEVLLISKS